MNILQNSEEQIMCPYNKAHYIRKGKMEKHLVKCRPTYTGKELVSCEFNPTHRIAEPELQYHHETCPDRKRIEIAVYKEEDPSVPEFPIPKISVPVDDSWDDSPPVASYNPEEYCLRNNVMRHAAIDTKPPSVRKNFRIQERQRINQITSGNINKNSVPGRNNSAIPSRSVKNVIVRNSDDLPPRPNQCQETIEPTPDYIKDLMGKLELGPTKAYVPVATKK